MGRKARPYHYGKRILALARYLGTDDLVHNGIYSFLVWFGRICLPIRHACVYVHGYTASIRFPADTSWTAPAIFPSRRSCRMDFLNTVGLIDIRDAWPNWRIHTGCFLP